MEKERMHERRDDRREEVRDGGKVGKVGGLGGRDDGWRKEFLKEGRKEGRRDEKKEESSKLDIPNPDKADDGCVKSSWQRQCSRIAVIPSLPLPGFFLQADWMI